MILFRFFIKITMQTNCITVSLSNWPNNFQRTFKIVPSLFLKFFVIVQPVKKSYPQSLV